jgi:hypothetical protein
LNVAVPKLVQRPIRKHAPLSTRYARHPVSVLKTSKPSPKSPEKTPNVTPTGSKSTILDEVQAGPVVALERRPSQTSSRSVPLLTEGKATPRLGTGTVLQVP